MQTNLARDVQAFEPSQFSIVKGRSKPRVILLDDALAIACAERSALRFLHELLGTAVRSADRLPPVVESAVRAAIESDPDAEEYVIMPTPQMIARIARLNGANSSFIAVCIERHSRREDLTAAARRFSLTRRETDVLGWILRGSSATEIADELSISESTVNDYFRNLIRKTRSRNRSEMLAKILNWTS